MCGRYRLSRRKQIIEEQFDTADWQDDWTPRYNIAPAQPVHVIRQNPKELRKTTTCRIRFRNHLNSGEVFTHCSMSG